MDRLRFANSTSMRSALHARLSRHPAKAAQAPTSPGEHPVPTTVTAPSGEKTMNSPLNARGIRWRSAGRALASGALVALVAATPLLLGISTPRAYADDNLPTYTSPIDITRGRIQLHAVAPDRDTGKPVEVP